MNNKQYNYIDVDLDEFYSTDINNEKEKSSSSSDSISDDLVNKILGFAIRNNHAKVNELIKSNRWVMKSLNADGSGVIHLFAYMGYTVGIDIILKNDGQVNFLDKSGQNCVHYSILANNIGLLRKLIKIGLDINLRDNDGNTPLHIAVIKDLSDCVKLLLDNDVDISIKNNKNHTAYDYAFLNKEIFLMINEYINRKK